MNLTETRTEEMEMVKISSDVEKVEWLLCPVCGNKTRIKLRQDTALRHHRTEAAQERI